MLCTVCGHEQRHEIDRELLAHRVAMSVIGRKYGLSDDALTNHLHRHIAARLHADKEAADLLDTQSLVAEIRDLHAHTRGQMEAAEESGDGRLVLLAVREGRANVDQLSKLSILKDFEVRAKAALALVNDVAKAVPGSTDTPAQEEDGAAESEGDDDPRGY